MINATIRLGRFARARAGAFAGLQQSPLPHESPVSVMTIDTTGSTVDERVMLSEETIDSASASKAGVAADAESNEEGHIVALSPEAARSSSVGTWVLLGAVALTIVGSVYVLRRR